MVIFQDRVEISIVTVICVAMCTVGGLHRENVTRQRLRTLKIVLLVVATTFTRGAKTNKRNDTSSKRWETTIYMQCSFNIILYDCSQLLAFTNQVSSPLLQGNHVLSYLDVRNKINNA
jgi:hypothetical protein